MDDEKSIFDKYNLIEYLAKSTLITIIGIAIVGFYPVIISEYYDSSVVGKLTFLVTAVGITRTFSSFGMSSLLLRTFANKNDELPLRATVTMFLVSSVTLLLLASIYDFEFFNLKLLLQLALPVSLISLLGAALQGLNYYNLAHLLKNSLVESVLLIALFFELIWGKTFNLPSVLNITVILVGVVMVFCLSLVVRALKNNRRRFSRSILSNVKKSGHLFFFSTFYLILSATDQFVILYYLDFAHLGNYAIAVGLSAFAAIGLTIVNAFTPALFAQLKDNIPELNRIAYFSSFMGVCISVVATIFVGLYLYFGIESQHKDTIYICFFILVFGNLFHSISGSAGFMCHMTGLEAKSSKVVMISAIANLIIGLLLVPYFGVIGAAIGTMVALIINKILLSYVAYNSLGMKSSFLYKYITD